MSDLTKEDVIKMAEQYAAAIASEYEAGELRRALATIDALEAELEEFETTVEIMDRHRHQDLDALHCTIYEIRDLATDELNTRVVGGHRQALERVIEILGGSE